MAAHHVHRILVDHHADTVDPVSEGAAGSAAQGVDVRPGLVEVVAGEHDPLLRQPDVDLVGGLSRGSDEIQADAGDLEGLALAGKPVRWLDWGAPGPRSSPRATRAAVLHHVSCGPTLGRNRDPDTESLLERKVETLAVGRPHASAETFLLHGIEFRSEVLSRPDLNAAVGLVECRCAVGVVAVTVGVDDRLDWQSADLLERRTNLGGRARHLAGIHDDDAAIPDDHRIRRDLVADGGVHVLGDLHHVRHEHFIALRQALGGRAGLRR